MFDDTSYFVTVGLSNTVQLRLWKLFNDVGTPRVSFVLPNLALLLFCSLVIFFFRPFPDVTKTCFNLRVSSLTEAGLYKHASELLEVVTGSVMADRNDERLSPRASGGTLHRLLTFHRFGR